MGKNRIEIGVRGRGRDYALKKESGNIGRSVARSSHRTSWHVLTPLRLILRSAPARPDTLVGPLVAEFRYIRKLVGGRF